MNRFLTKSSFIVLVVFTAYLLLAGCWQKQDHGVNAPTVPLYKLYGTVHDIDSGKILPNCNVFIEPKFDDLLYDWVPLEPSVVTDSAGYYELDVTPGNYTIYAMRENCIAFEQKITIYHQDRLYLINLPKIEITSVAMPFASLQGLCIKPDGSLAIASTWQTGNGDRSRIFSGFFQGEFTVLGKTLFHPENPDFKGLVYNSNSFLTFTGSLAEPQIGEVNDKTGKLVRNVPAIHRLNDFTFDDNDIWATATNSTIYNMTPNTYQIKNTFKSPHKYPTGITWTGEFICSYDSSSHYLYKHNPNFTVKETRKLYYFDETNKSIPLKKGLYLGSDKHKYIYVAEENKIFRFPR
jgi:hypothetical protein